MDVTTAPALRVAVRIPGGGACGSLSAEPLARAQLQPECPPGRRWAPLLVLGAVRQPLSERPCWSRGGPQSRWAAGAGAEEGTRSWSFDLPGELPREKTVIREEAESFVCWSTGDWTRATQVICHLLTGLINGRRVGRGGLPAHSQQIHTGSSG